MVFAAGNVSNAVRRAPALPWSALLALIAIAGLLRWLAYSGFFGSDEVTYTASAFRLLDGDWSVSSYVGANRYGVNLPVAFFGWLFGRNEFAAASYSLLSSLLEIGLVAWFGARMFGARAGILAGLLLATLPMHVHFAGRLMADAPLALAVTASFLFFWDGAVTRRPWSYFVAGVAVGAVFWIKPAVIFYALVFVTYPLVFRRLDTLWVWMIAGFALMMVANGVFFHVLTGNFWFAIENMAARVGSGYLEVQSSTGKMINEPGYYLTYLFLKAYHTGLLGYLAALCVVIWWWRRRRALGTPAALSFVGWWAGGLLLILSVLVVSLSPFILVPKQTNYMLMFVAPLALLGGYALASIPRRWKPAAVLAVTLPAVVLAMMLQATVTVFTANSKALLIHSAALPDATFYANANGYRAGQFYALVNPGERKARILRMGDWRELDPNVSADPLVERYAVVDMETIEWARDEPFRRLEDRPGCWIPEGRLEPAVEGLGPSLINGMATIAGALPGFSTVAARLARLAEPAPAYVFRIPAAGC